MSTVLNGATPTAAVSDERSLGRLVADATRDLSGLVRDELDLAKSELRDDVKAGVRGSVMFIAAGFLALVSFIFLAIAAAYGIHALGLHEGWAFLIVTGALLLIAGILVLIGVRQVKKVGPPTRTIETTKESVAVLRGGTSALS